MTWNFLCGSVFKNCYKFNFFAIYVYSWIGRYKAIYTCLFFYFSIVGCGVLSFSIRSHLFNLSYQIYWHIFLSLCSQICEVSEEQSNPSLLKSCPVLYMLSHHTTRMMVGEYLWTSCHVPKFSLCHGNAGDQEDIVSFTYPIFFF